MSKEHLGRVVFVDCETTGLNPFRHEVWECALFSPERGWMVLQRDPNLRTAEPEALIVNRFYERRAQAASTRTPDVPVAVELLDDKSFARRVARALSGATMVGIGPWFDAQFLELTLRKAGESRAWDHRLVCAKLLAVPLARIKATGELAERLESPPFHTSDVAEALGIELNGQHSAYHDVMTAIKFYEVAMGVALGAYESDGGM